VKFGLRSGFDETQMHSTQNSWKKLEMFREGLKLTDPQSFWEPSMHA